MGAKLVGRGSSERTANEYSTGVYTQGPTNVGSVIKFAERAQRRLPFIPAGSAS